MSKSAENRQPISEDTRKRLSESKTGELHPMYGKTHSEETKLKMSLAHNGNTHSEETKNKMRKPKSIIKCPQCGKEGGNSQMKRYHFDNCKYNIQLI